MSGRPEGRKAKRPSMVAAVELAGAQAPWRSCAAFAVNGLLVNQGMEGRATCGCPELSRASGIPIEKLAAEPDDPDDTAEPRKAASKPDSESRRPKVS